MYQVLSWVMENTAIEMDEVPVGPLLSWVSLPSSGDMNCLPLHLSLSMVPAVLFQPLLPLHLSVALASWPPLLGQP